MQSASLGQKKSSSTKNLGTTKNQYCFPNRSSSIPIKSDTSETEIFSVKNNGGKSSSLPDDKISTTTVISPKSSFCKISLLPKQKPLKVMVLGQGGVGKSALVVRFITRRYIGEYDPNLEKVYTFHTVMDNEMVYFEILDTAGQPHETECLTLESNIRWAEAFILLYSVTDKCSFDECNRLKFLINYIKRRRRLGSNNSRDSTTAEVPVVLVGNKTDQIGDRMVALEDGQKRSREIGCVCFHEISVRESVDQVWNVFRDTYRFWKVHNRFPKLKRSSSDVRSPEGGTSICSKTSHSLNNSPPASRKSPISPIATSGCTWCEGIDFEDSPPSVLKEEDEDDPGNEVLPPFRGRAQTDGHLLSRPRRSRYPPPAPSSYCQYAPLTDRRMSISMRGNNASC